MAAFDVSQPNAPTSIGSTQITIPYPSLSVTDALVCVAGLPSGSTSPILQISDSNFNLESTIPAFISSSGSDKLVVSGTTAYLSSTDRGDIYNLADPATPVKTGSFSGDIAAVSGTLAFGVRNNTLSVYDISNPLQPLLKGSIATNGGNQIAASGNRVYITGSNSATSARYLQAFDVSNATAPVLLATATSESTTNSIAANGNTVYLIDGINATLNVYTLNGAPLAAAASLGTSQSIFPNPAHGTITVAHAAANAPVTIFDALGKVHLKTTLPITNKLDISTLPSGLYTARVGDASYRLAIE